MALAESHAQSYTVEVGDSKHEDTWEGGVATSFVEHADQTAAYEQTQSPSDKFLAVVQVSAFAWAHRTGTLTSKIDCSVWGTRSVLIAEE